MAMWFFEVATEGVMTLDPEAWVWDSTLVSMLAIAAVTAVAAGATLGKRVLLSEEV
jgi:hypothetical protein